MDYRCPACRADLRKRKLSQAVVVRMEIDCPRCGSRIRLNVHGIEAAIVTASFGAFVVLAALGYWLRSEGLMLGALGVALLGALALLPVERTWLRSWPRYAVTAAGSSGPPSPRR